MDQSIPGINNVFSCLTSEIFLPNSCFLKIFTYSKTQGKNTALDHFQFFVNLMQSAVIA